MDALVSSSLVSAGVGFLAALAWKSSLVLGLAFVLARLCARRSAALRHGVWTLAVLVLLALPLVQALAPPLAAPLPFVQGRPAATATTRAAAPPIEIRDVSGAATAQEHGTSPGTTTGLRPSSATNRNAAPSWPQFVLFAWLAGTLAVASFFAAGQVALSRLARRARPVDDAEWQAMARAVAAQLGARGPVRLLVANDATSPLTWGVWRPTVLLPATAAAWSPAQRRSFLVHELAHVARRDCAIQEAAHLACALYWFHPGAWFAAHRLRVEREPACDDRVLADGAAAEAYARQLLDVVRGARVPRGAMSLSGAAMAAPSQLETRVRALLDGGRDRRRIGRGRAFVAGGLALALLLPLAAVVPMASARSNTAQANRVDATTGGPLAERWERALRERRGGAFWFAYAIPFAGRQDGKEVLLSDSEGWNADDLEGRGTTLAERLASGDQDAVLLFRVPAGGAGEPGFDRVALRSAHLSPDLGGLPVVAVGPVPLEESFSWLAARLDEAPADRRAAVLVSAIALHDLPRTARFLEDLLSGRREEAVRVQAAEGLARHPGERTLAALVAHARRDPSQDVRREAAESVGDLDYAPATAALIRLAHELDDEQVRAEAVESLGEREPGRVLDVLVKVADEDPSGRVRREAVETLGDLPDNAGLEVLRRMAMRHADPDVRSEAVETLNEMSVRAERMAKQR